MSDKKILFVTVTFPPRLSVASLRLYNYAKLFHQHGWKVYVISAKQSGEKSSDEFDFNGLTIDYVKWIDPYDLIIKIRVKLLKKILFKFLNLFVPYLATWLPDIRFFSWRKAAFNKAQELINKESIKYVYTSFSPISPHMIGKRIKENMDGVYWMAEYRDLCSFNHANSFFKKPFKKFHFKFERRIISSSDLILTASNGYKEILSKFLDKKIHVLYNGCDFDSFKKIKNNPSKTFKVIFTGNIYMKFYDVSLFLKSFRIFIDSITNQNRKVELLFIGTHKSKLLIKCINKYKLSNHVKFLNTMPNYKVKIHQNRASLLLHFIWTNDNKKGVLAGKLFEYIASRKPILIVGREKEIEKIIDTHKCGVFCDTSKDIVKCLLYYYYNVPKIEDFSNQVSSISKLNQFLSLEKQLLIK